MECLKAVDVDNSTAVNNWEENPLVYLWSSCSITMTLKTFWLMDWLVAVDNSFKGPPGKMFPNTEIMLWKDIFCSSKNVQSQSICQIVYLKDFSTDQKYPYLLWKYFFTWIIESNIKLWNMTLYFIQDS